MPSSAPLNVVVAGGGVAAIETALALHDLAGARVRLTLIAPEREFALRPLRTAEPFAADHVRRHSLPVLAHRVGAELRSDVVVAVEPGRRAVRLAGGATLGYDALVLAVGAVPHTPFPRALTFGADERTVLFNGLLADLEEGWSTSVAFVVPPGSSWPLPLYELALMTAAELRSMGKDDVALEIVTPELTPLEVFGPAASAAVDELLRAGAIAVRTGARAVVGEDGRPAVDGAPLTAQRVVTLPTLDGPAIVGVPSDERGFIPVDVLGRVRGLDDVFAAGDGTTFPIKQGGLACQMADVVAEGLAARAGAAVTPSAFDPVLRGHLLTPRGAEVLAHPLRAGGGQDAAPALQLWSPAHKIDGRYLSAWLTELEGGAPVAAAAEPKGVAVEVPLRNAWQEGRDAMRLDPYGPLARR
jgi:sulfide:quinone oxidoreductase